jgi:hypothetical protein
MAVSATFAVDRVWKGAVPRQFDLYIPLAYGLPSFTADHAYVVGALRMTNKHERHSVGLDNSDEVAFRPVDCGAHDLNSPAGAEMVAQTGQGYAPR